MGLGMKEERKAGTEVPSSSYYPELCIYDASSICLVDQERRGVIGSCSTLRIYGILNQINNARSRQHSRSRLGRP